MGFTFGKKSLDRLELVDTRIRELMQNAIRISPIDFGIPEFGGLRTKEQQYQLYKNGLSKCDGYKKMSLHQTGNAIDIYAYVNGKASWDKIHLAIVAGVILGEAARMNLKIRWGGTFGSNTFTGWDMPHFELIKSKNR